MKVLVKASNTLLYIQHLQLPMPQSLFRLLMVRRM
jgi:hypothetical protein